MKFAILSLLVLFAAAPAFAKDCAYCGKLEALKASATKVKPDPMNEETIDEQNELLDQAEGLIREIVRDGKPSDAELGAVVEVLEVAVPFDYSNSLGESLVDTFKPYADRLFGLVRKEQKAKHLTKALAEDIIINLAIGENTVEHGTDSAH